MSAAVRRGLLMTAGGGGPNTAKSVVLDFADNHGDATFLGIFSIDFYLGESLITLLSADFTAYETSRFDDSYFAKYAFDTSIPKFGGIATQTWLTDTAITNQRLIVVPDSEITFDGIVINNFHNNGGLTTVGVNNAKIYYTAATYTDTTYGAAVTGGVKIYDSVFREHNGLNQADPETLVLI